MDGEIHQALLKKWRARPRHATETFISDGPIDPNRWKKVDRRVLFLAKEAYGEMEPGETWDLPELIREEWKGPKYKLWRVAGYWAYGIHRLTDGPIPSIPMDGKCQEEVTEALLASAVVNVKKSSGRSSSDDDDLRKYVAEDGDLLKQQVACLNPHVVVCCNTWHLVRKDVWPHAKRVSELVYSMDGMLVLDFWHPANRFPNVMNYYTALALLHQALFSTNPSLQPAANLLRGLSAAELGR